MSFNITEYVKTVSNQKAIETELETATKSARSAHLSFYSFLRVDNNTTLEIIKGNAMSQLQNVSGNWPVESGKKVGYQKASKAGCNEATCYNRFTAWTVTNVHVDGHLLTDSEKEAIKTDRTNKQTLKQSQELETAIETAIKEKGLIDGTNLVELTDEVCIQFLTSKGYKVTPPKK